MLFQSKLQTDWRLIHLKQLDQNFGDFKGGSRTVFILSRLWHLKQINDAQLLSVLIQKQPLEMFYKKAALNNFVIFTGKHLCWSLLLIKLQAWRRLQHKCFLVNIAKFLRTPILKNICNGCFCQYLSKILFRLNAINGKRRKY